MLMARLNVLSTWKYITGTYDLINARNRNKLHSRINAVHLKRKTYINIQNPRGQMRNEIFAREPA